MSFITNTPIIQSISDSSITAKIGVTLQAHASKLDDIAALLLTSGNFIVSNGSNFIVESGVTARTSLGLGDIAILNASAFVKTDGTSIITADLNMNSKKIINVSTPISNADAANKLYVDNIASGLNVKKSVIVTTTLNIILSGTQTIDTVVLNIGDRILVKNQTIQTENGIYDIAFGAWTRSPDADNTPLNEVSGGMFTFIESGSQGGTGWILSNIVGNAILGTDNLIFTQFSTSATILAGVNLSKTGNTIDLNPILTNFASTGILDNSTSTQLTISDTNSIFSGEISLTTSATQAVIRLSDAGTTGSFVPFIATASNELRFRSGHNASSDLTINSVGQAIFSNAVTINNVTDSTSTATGSIITAGGIGISKALHVGGNINVGGTGIIANPSINNMVINSIAAASGITIGTSTTGVGYIAWATPTSNNSAWLNFNHSIDTFDFRSASASQMTISSSEINCQNNVIKTSNTADSTSSATGSIQTAGGLGVAKNINIGGQVGIGIGSTSGYSVTLASGLGGAFRISNGGELGFINLEPSGELKLWAHGDLSTDLVGLYSGTGSGTQVASFNRSSIILKAPTVVTSTLSVNNTADSTSTTTGSIQTAGGLGIRKNISQGNPASNTVIQHMFSNFPANFFVGVNSTAANKFVGSSSGYGFIGVSGATGIEIATNNTVALKINSSGDQTVRGGISFSGKSAIPANLLDDYEEGIWTPTVAGETTAGTYTLNLASFAPTYIKIGRMVHVDAELLFTAAAGGVGNLVVGGLPFLYSNGRGVIGPLVHANFNVAAGVSDVNIIAKTTTPGSDLYIWESTNNAALKVASITEISTSTNLRFSLTYQV